MRYFANPTTPSVRDAQAAGRLGVIETPLQQNRPVPGAAWIADNGCYGKGFRETRWWGWLRQQAGRRGCVFATAPDVVGDAAATLRRSAPWLPRLRELGYAAAFVGQDGLEDLTVPWDDFDCLFLGGTTTWKVSPEAAELADEARARGKWLHMGRVNSIVRLRYASWLHCDSVDGTYITYGPDINLPRLLRFLDVVDSQPRLFDRGDVG